MTQHKKLLIILVLLSFTLFVHMAYGFPSSEFTLKNGNWYDSWDINRSNYGGEKGYLPNLASETLGPNKELAYSIGESLRSSYGDKVQAAEAILRYVQTWTIYGYDNENVYRDGVAQEEWAWNADEMAHAINGVTGVRAVGDCEDLSFLCGTMYTGAGIDAAIVDAPGHVACLIWLPEYPNANQYWDIENDNLESGWIWVEATGNSNPLGWTPPDFGDGDWNAYPLGSQTSADQQSKPMPTEILLTAGIIIIILAFGAIVLFKKRKRNPPPPPPPPPLF